MKGLWAVTVRANWHVTFRFEEGEACDVDVVDYHEEETSDESEEPTSSRPHYSARVHHTARPVRDRSRALGVERQTLINLVNEKSGISPEMAIRLEKGFGSSAEMWCGLQMEYDLAQAEKHADKIKVARIR